MEILKNYIVKQETMAFLPKYGENGTRMTIVMESHYTFEALSSPTELVDFSLKYYGSSLRGAGDGSRAVLGNITKYPVLMCERLDLYWFPSKSPKLHDCIWFGLHHVKSYSAYDKKKTKVVFSNGSSIVVEVSLYAFELRIQRAYRLRYMLDERTKFTFLMANEPKERYHFRKQKDGLNYENGLPDIE